MSGDSSVLRTFYDNVENLSRIHLMSGLNPGHTYHTLKQEVMGKHKAKAWKERDAVDGQLFVGHEQKFNNKKATGLKSGILRAILCLLRFQNSRIQFSSRWLKMAIL